MQQFRGKFWFLSNFYPCVIEHKGKKYPSAEHLFQALKSTDAKTQEAIRKASTPHTAKQIGRAIKLRPDWNKIKRKIMFTVVLLKFRQNPTLLSDLLLTGEGYLEEGNTWHDNYWGNCCCSKCESTRGYNYLGGILMTIRERLR